jgi:signal transduction histidine kinase
MAAIIVLVLAVSLALTYEALVTTRLDVTHERLRRVAIQIVQSTEPTIAARMALYRQTAADPAVLAALRAAAAAPAPADSSPIMRAAAIPLLRLRAQPDSSLPIELWTTDGRRVLNLGTDVRGDSLVALAPELRTRSGKPISEIPAGRSGEDSVLYGALYASSGKSLYWTIVPVLDHGKRIGVIAQQRQIRSSPQSAKLFRELVGNDAALFVHNVTDDYWTTLLGNPTAPITGLDTLRQDFVGQRAGVGAVTAYEARINHTPWAFELEVPLSVVLAEPRATVRHLMLISLLLAAAGALVAWLASRRITHPLVSLTSVSEAIARGAYDTRMPQDSLRPTRDEVARLANSFNRMASEIEASHHELEQQVEEALAVSSELEHTNEQLQELSTDAEEARDAAQQANRAKGDFLAVMSHELRTPLNAIGGYTEILQLGIYGAVSDQQREALGRIARSQQMLLSLINDVLNFAKLDAGQIQYRIANVSLTEALGPVESLVAPQLAARTHSYRFQCDSSLVVRADRDKLQQIALNLLTNAIKFTPDGGSITLSCRAEGDFALVQVSDDGIGIAADRLDSVFDPFVQVDRALNRPHEGVGLGLSISRDLAHGMGGTLTARSTPSEGSVFTLKLRRSAATLTA